MGIWPSGGIKLIHDSKGNNLNIHTYIHECVIPNFNKNYEWKERILIWASIDYKSLCISSAFKPMLIFSLINRSPACCGSLTFTGCSSLVLAHPPSPTQSCLQKGWAPGDLKGWQIHVPILKHYLPLGFLIFEKPHTH